MTDTEAGTRGSGTTMLDAKNTGRNGAGIETEEFYCNSILQRLEADRNLFEDFEIDYIDLSHEMDTYT